MFLFLKQMSNKSFFYASYQVGLHVQFVDEDAHDAYQIHELHQIVIGVVKRVCLWDNELHVKAFDFAI